MLLTQTSPSSLDRNMAWESLMGADFAKTLTQYPDARLYNAAKRLRPEDRPTVPVRLTENPQEQFDRYKGVPDADLPEGFTLPDHQAIWLNARKSKILSNPVRLAGNMGHEQNHITGGDELQARQKETDILRYLGEKRYAELIRQHYGLK